MFYVVPVYDRSLNEFCFCDILPHTKSKFENPKNRTNCLIRMKYILKESRESQFFLVQTPSKSNNKFLFYAQSKMISFFRFCIAKEKLSQKILIQSYPKVNSFKLTHLARGS